MQSQTTTHRRARSAQGLLALALGLACAATQAATITVTTDQDGASGCTLRAALQNVNAQGQPNTNCAAATGGDVISVPAGIYTLLAANGPLAITRSVTIQGAGMSVTTVRGGSTAKTGVRVLDVLGNGITVTLQNLAVRNGNARPDGGAMSSAGGLYVAPGAMVTVADMLFQDNWADSSGGAIENRGTLAVQGSTFTGNQARGEGGAIRNIGVLHVLDSTFTGNEAERGGAIWVSTATGTVPVSNTSFNGNQATGVGGGTVFYGGALMNADESGATLVLTNNSYTTNTAGGSGDVVWEGNPQVALAGATQPIMVGTGLALAAKVQGSYVLPTGQVTLRSGGGGLAGCTNLALTETNPVTTPPTGEVQCAATGLRLGLHTLTAAYAGDNNHGTGVSPAVGQIVNGYTNANTTTVTVTGPEGATVWAGGTQHGTLGSAGVLDIFLSTPAPDGNKTFLLETRVGATVLTSGTLTLIRDTVAPAWSGMQPANAGYLRTGSTLDYTLSENAASASITLTRTGGSPDPVTRTCTLQGAALLAGARQVSLGAAPDGCVNALTLVEGTTYTLTFVATDAAGNVSAGTTTTGITYDTQPPVFSGLTPAAGSALKADSLLGYTLSENVASASIVATRTSGAADGLVHTCALQGTALAAGAHQVSLAAGPNGCAQALALVDGATYTLVFAAADPAGNTAASPQVTGITYDTTTPMATLVLPPYSTSRTVNITLGGSDVGGTGVTDYCLQVSNTPGTCAWASTAPASFTFAADGLQTLHGFVRDRAGNVSAAESASVTVDTAPPLPPTLTTVPTWVTGNSVTVEVNGEPGARVWVDGTNTGVLLDSAGKASITLDTSGMAEGSNRIFHITLRDAAGNPSAAFDLRLGRDETPPAFSALAPTTDGYLKADSILGYTLSESVTSASITFSHSGGSADAGTPHTCVLQGTALQAGSHTVPLSANTDGCAQALALVDGARYTLSYTAADAAGNASAAVQITGVMYDNTAPTASLMLPAHSASRNVALTLGGSDGGSGIGDYCLRTVNDASGCLWTPTAPTHFTVGTDGTHALYGFVRDLAGNVSLADSGSVDVDTGMPNPPTLTDTPTWVTGNSVILEVNGEAGAQVWIDGADTGQALDGTGKASITLDTSGMAEGSSHTFHITLRDAAGNSSTALDLHLGRDGLRPVFSALAPPTGGAIKADSTLGYTLSEDVVSASITFAHSGGSADAGAPHTCTLQGAALQAGARTVALAADANGCAANLALVDGAIYTLQFAGADAAGNGSAPTQVTDIHYDTTPPASPMVTSPANGATGAGASVTMAGTAEDGSRVEVREGAALLAQGMATGGSFSIQVQGLTYGLHAFELTATDAAGNVSAAQPLAYTAYAPTTVPPEPPNPPVVTGGTVTVPPGDGVTVNGPAQVTAGPGSTVTLLPGSGGTTIVLPAGGGAPVSVVIGGQTFSVQPQEGGVLTLSVVTLVGADGSRQVALVLNPSRDGASRVTLGGTVGAGTVVGMLRTDGGNLPLTAVGSGPVSVVLEAGKADEAGAPAPRWRIFVAQGQVALSGVPGAEPLTLLGGEVARLDGAGHLLSARLGAANGQGLGDPVERTDLPAGVLGQFGYVHLDGVPARWSGSQTVEQRIATVLQGMGIPMAPAAPDGSVRWTIGANPVSVVPLEIQVATGRADGVSVAADGSIEVASGGLVTRFGPALHDLPGLVRELGAAGGTTEVASNGGLRVTLGGTVFQLRPAWWPLGALGQPPGFAVLPSVGLVTTGADGISHALMGDVADRAALNDVLSQAVGHTVTVQTGLDMVTSVELDGQRFELIPDAMLLPASTGPASAPWWLEGSKLFVRYPSGMVQGFEIVAR